jgi:hypothetical protein
MVFYKRFWKILRKEQIKRGKKKWNEKKMCFLL